MPLDGSDVASKPAGTTAVANTTIESADYNATVDDIYSIFNTVRTIAKGFTGATTAAGARTNFGIASMVVDKSSAYTALLADRNKTFNFTAAATLSLTAAATLTSDWFIYVKANGGAVTIDPNGSETIDGQATVVIPDGTSAMVICDGAGFRSVFTAPELLDEDDMSSDSATAVPSQQSVKAYVDNRNPWVHLSTQTPSAAGWVALTDLSSYRTIRITGQLYPATDGTSLFLRTSTNNGSTYDSGASDYLYHILRANSTTVSVAYAAATHSFFISPTVVGNAGQESISFSITLHQFNQATYCWMEGTATQLDQLGGSWVGTIAGQRLNTTPRNALQMLFTGNISAGTVTFEGMQ